MRKSNGSNRYQKRRQCPRCLLLKPERRALESDRIHCEECRRALQAERNAREAAQD